MKQAFVFSLLLLLSCDQKKRADPESSWEPDSLSLWLIKNEDSLNNELVKLVESEKSLLSKNERLLSKDFKPTQGILFELTSKVAKATRCAELIYRYTPQHFPKFELFLTANYNPACVGGVDSVFKDVAGLKHFIIQRYNPPSVEFSGYMNVDNVSDVPIADTLSPQDFAFDVVKRGNRYDLVLYLRKRVSLSTEEGLVREIFGERVLLKQIGQLTTIYDSSGSQGRLNYKQVRQAFGLDTRGAQQGLLCKGKSCLR